MSNLNSASRPGPPAVVLGMSATGLAVARELARAGVEVWGVAEGMEPGSSSRRLKGRVFRWNGDDVLLLNHLLAFSIGDRPLLLPTSDRTIEFLARHATVLGRRFRFSDSYAGGISAELVDKAGFLALCRRHGLPHPATAVACRSELPLLAGKLAYPSILKPARGDLLRDFLNGAKALVVTSPEQYRRLVEAVPEGTNWLVQEIVRGPDSNVRLVGVYMDRAGRPQQVFTGRKLRQFPPGFGVASYALSSPEPDLARLAVDFLQAVGFTGIASVEFKIDSRDGRPRVIEINPRPALWIGLAEAAGKRLALSAYRDLCTLPALPEAPQLDGVRWQYFLKDAYSAWFYMRRPKTFLLPAPDVAGQLRQAGGAKRWAVFEAGDPAPAAIEIATYVPKAIRRLAKSLLAPRRAATRTPPKAASTMPARLERPADGRQLH